MFSHIRVAHLGLVAVAGVFLTCVGILGGRAAERATHAVARAPEFSLVSVDGQHYTLAALRGKVVVLLFTGTQCPYSADYLQRLAEFGRHYQNHAGVQVLMINTDAPAEEPAAVARQHAPKSAAGQFFPTLIDSGRVVTRAYRIVHTPTVCVIDPSGELRYQGAFDDNRNERLVSSRYCEDAVANLLNGQAPKTISTQAFDSAVARSK